MDPGDTRGAAIINVIGLAVGLWGFWAVPYRMAVLACALAPLAVVVAVRSSDGRIVLLEGPRGSRRADVMFGFLFPITALCLRGLDFSLVDLQSVLAPVAALTAALALLIWMVGRDPNDRPWRFLLIVPFLAAYSLGVLMEANVLLDRSRPLPYAVKVTGQRASSGSRGRRYYYLKVSPWGSQVEDNDVPVSSRMYEQTKVGDTVHIVVRSGYFKIPWYALRP